MFCRYCGKEIADDAFFCQCCGKRQDERNAEGPGAQTGSQNEAQNGAQGPNGSANPQNGAPGLGGANGPNGGYYGRYPYYPEPDIPSAGWGVLGFFFPLVGLILYLVWQQTMPNRAHMCGKGALISVIVVAAFFVFIFIITIIIMLTAAV